MIRILAVNFTSILDCSHDASKTAAENASNEMVMGAVQASCEFSLLVSQQNHLHRFLKAQDDALKQCYQKQCIFLELKLSKSANAKVDDQLARVFHKFCEQNILQICAAMEALLYEAEKVSVTKHRQLQVRLNIAWQAATIGQMLIVKRQFSDWSKKSIR